MKRTPYRRLNEERFLASRASCRVSAKVIKSLEVIADAVEGVVTLSQLGEIHYYTKRANAEATKEWLALKHFPNPGGVIFCRETTDKLDAIHDQEKASSLVLIDDRFTELLLGFEQLTRDKPPVADELKKRLTLVAFGVSAIPKETYGLRVLTLPSWKRVGGLIASLGLSADHIASRAI
jgi:hypothetical protein